MRSRGLPETCGTKGGGVLNPHLRPAELPPPLPNSFYLEKRHVLVNISQKNLQTMPKHVPHRRGRFRWDRHHWPWAWAQICGQSALLHENNTICGQSPHTQILALGMVRAHMTVVHRSLLNLWHLYTGTPNITTAVCTLPGAVQQFFCRHRCQKCLAGAEKPHPSSGLHCTSSELCCANETWPV